MLRTIFIAASFCLLLGSCNNKSQPSGNSAKNYSPVFIDISDYKFIQSPDSLYSEKKIIELKCKTNFPDGTVVVFISGKGKMSTNTSPKDDAADTVKVQNRMFTTYLSPSFLLGYAGFRVYEPLQSDSIISVIGKGGKNLVFENSEKVKQLQKYYKCLFSVDYNVRYKVDSL
ncbi:MAG: hypothetical protein ACXVED_19665, partial [Bacteroidia bacterium]